jgi:hypothetical protein
MDGLIGTTGGPAQQAAAPHGNVGGGEVTYVEQSSRFTSFIGLVRLRRGGRGLRGPSAAGGPPPVRARRGRHAVVERDGHWEAAEDCSQRCKANITTGSFAGGTRGARIGAAIDGALLLGLTASSNHEFPVTGAVAALALPLHS